MGSRTRAEELEDGRHRRHAVPRSDHGAWEPAPNRADPVELVEAQNRGRIAELVPVRIGRMVQSPFAFLRGASLVMAHDLAATPDTGLDVQVCGDAHVANFGLFASPEGTVLFDLNDFDETDVGPWEWDVKRLCASAAVVARVAGRPRADQEAAGRAAATSYRTHMADYAAMAELALWSARVDAEAATRLVGAAGPADRAQVRADVRAATHHTDAALLPKLTALAPDGSRRIVDHPPVVTHDLVDRHRKLLRDVTAGYLPSLEDDRRALVGRFEVVDFAIKVVGVGSVGTRCFIGLLLDETGQPLLLQMKEAERSVLDQVGAGVPVPGRHHGYGVQGRRVVDGQRRIQAATDVFLGWAGAEGIDYYIRRLRDQKGGIDVTSLGQQALLEYAALCGWVLARGHARSAGAGSAARIAGYVGGSEAFDDSLGKFALAYAAQTEQDHAALVTAVRAGRLPSDPSV
jgi:uncharacterized protein (DUF2252 family)